MALNIAPGVYSTTIDESFYEVDNTLTSLVSLHTIFSNRGPDNQIVKFGLNSEEAIRRYYGDPNFTKFGQSYHTAMQWASAGYETSICRLMPQDATFANVGLFYKKTAVEIAKIPNKITDKAETTQIEVTSLDEIVEGMDIYVTGNFKGEELAKLTDDVMFSNLVSNKIAVSDVEKFKVDQHFYLQSSEFKVTAIHADTKEIELVLVDEIDISAASGDNIYEKDTKEMKLTVKSFEETEDGVKLVTLTEPFECIVMSETSVIKKTKGIISKSVEKANEKMVFENLMKLPVGDYDDAKNPDYTGSKITDENIEFPLVIFYAIGRGIDYNKMSLQFSLDADLTDTYPDFAVYTMRVYDKRSEKGTDYMIGGEEFSFSFYPDAEDVNGMSLYFTEVISLYTKSLQFIINDYKIKLALCDLYDIDFATALDHEIYSKDIFKGDIAFNDINNNRFKEGSDGSLWNKEGSINWGTKEEIESGELNNATNLLKEFYLGRLDKSLLNRKSVRCKYIWDNNYPLEVKQVMASLVDGPRNDIRYIADTRMQASEESELKFRKEVFNISSENVTIYPNNGMATDKFNGKKIRVTSTYPVCKNYAFVKNTFGPHYAVGGYNAKGRLDDFISIQYTPTEEARQQFTKYQLNTILSDPSGIFVMENISSLKKSTALQQNHIADTLQIIRVEVEDFCQKYVLSLRLTDKNIKEAEQEVSIFLQKWVDNGALEWCSVKTQANAQQRAQQRLKFIIDLKFVGIAKAIDLEFHVKGEGAQP